MYVHYTFTPLSPFASGFVKSITVITVFAQCNFGKGGRGLLGWLVDIMVFYVATVSFQLFEAIFLAI